MANLEINIKSFIFQWSCNNLFAFGYTFIISYLNMKALQFYLMRNQQSNKGASLPFLERFQGKKSTITKEGILHLFQIHQTKVANIASPITEQKPMNIDVSKVSLKERIQQIKRSGHDLRGQAKESRSSRLSYRTEILKNQNQGTTKKKDDFVLPKIFNKFNSSHNKLTYSQRRELQVKSQANNENAKQKPPKKVGYMFGKNMDENAIQHLQFLNKLQQKLSGLRNKNENKR